MTTPARSTAILGAIRNFQNSGINPSVADIANTTGISTKDVRSAIAQLELDGHIRVERPLRKGRYQPRNIYHLPDDAVAAPDGSPAPEADPYPKLTDRQCWAVCKRIRFLYDQGLSWQEIIDDIGIVNIHGGPGRPQHLALSSVQLVAMQGSPFWADMLR